MAAGPIEKEISWLTADGGARRCGVYLDQLKAAIDECCKATIAPELAALRAENERLTSAVKKLAETVQSLKPSTP
jgi:hypothetical protein